MTKGMIGLDIGVSQVCAARLELYGRSGEARVLGVAKEPVEPVSDAEGSATLIESQMAAVLRLREAGHLNGSQIAISFNGLNATIFSLSLPFREAKKIEAVLPGLIEGRVPFELEEMTYCWAFQDDQKGSDESKIMIALAKKEPLKYLLEQLAATGVDPSIVVPKPVALLALAERMGRDKRSILILVDLERDSTSIVATLGNEFLVGRTLGKGSALQELVQTKLFLEAQFKVPVGQVLLLGEGSRNAEAVSQIGETLSIPTEVLELRQLNLGIIGADEPTMMSIGLALKALSSGSERNKLNLRQGEFAWMGEYEFARERAVPMGIWVVVIFALLFGYGFTRSISLSQQAKDLDARAQSVCKQIVGKQLSPSSCLAAMKMQINQADALGIPKMAASDVYLELANQIPPDIQVKVADLDITETTVRMEGEVTLFDSVDKIVTSLARQTCFKKVEKGRARQTQTGIDFQISFDVQCSPTQAPKVQTRPRKGGKT